MKTLKSKLVVMAIFYSLCNYLIWYDAYPCISESRIHTSFFLGISPQNTLFYPLCVVLPILLFQPHIIILYKREQLMVKKDRLVFFGCSLGMIIGSLLFWFFFIY